MSVMQQSSRAQDAEVRCVPRWTNKHQLRMPRWADEPAKCLERGLLPVHLLRPADIAKDINAWVDEATKPLKPRPTDTDGCAER